MGFHHRPQARRHPLPGRFAGRLRRGRDHGPADAGRTLGAGPDHHQQSDHLQRLALRPRRGDDPRLPDPGADRLLRQLLRAADDRRQGRGLPAGQCPVGVAVLCRYHTGAADLRRPRSARRDVDRLSALLDEHHRQHRALYFYGAGARLRLDHRRRELPHHGGLHARAGTQVDQPQHLRLVHPGRLRPATDLRPGAGHGGDADQLRQVPRHQLLRPDQGRRRAYLPEPVLVLLAPGRVRDLPALHRRHLRDRHHLRQESALQLQHDRLRRHLRHRRPVRRSVGPPPLCLRHGRLDPHRHDGVDAADLGARRPAGDRPGRYPVPRLDHLRDADALRPGRHVSVPDRRPHRHPAGRDLADRAGR